MDEVENFFCQFPNPWALKVSGMGCYFSKCEKNSKSLHPNTQHPCTNQPAACPNISKMAPKICSRAHLRKTRHDHACTGNRSTKYQIPGKLGPNPVPAQVVRSTAKWLVARFYILPLFILQNCSGIYRSRHRISYKKSCNTYADFFFANWDFRGFF